MRFTLRHLLIAVTIIACVIGFLRATYIELTYVETAENVKRVDWLPEYASNISYYRSYSFTSYEFDIAEPDFVVWARGRWDIKPISEPVSVFRYTYCAPRIPEPTGQGDCTIS